jgi:hypothetical protein
LLRRVGAHQRTRSHASLSFASDPAGCLPNPVATVLWRNAIRVARGYLLSFGVFARTAELQAVEAPAYICSRSIAVTASSASRLGRVAVGVAPHGAGRTSSWLTRGVHSNACVPHVSGDTRLLSNLISRQLFGRLCRHIDSARNLLAAVNLGRYSFVEW